MDEYISKQAFKDKYLCCGYLPEMSETEFDTFPAASVAEVRHGYWYDCGSLSCRCSKCGCKNNRETAYCPSCGARMGKEDEHD